MDDKVASCSAGGLSQPATVILSHNKSVQPPASQPASSTFISQRTSQPAERVLALPGVRRISVCNVTPAPAPEENVKVKLSFLDVPWVATRPVQQVYVYERPTGCGGADEFAAVVRRLKESLAASLALYLPLAGNLAYVEDTKDLVVDCSQPGVAFFEAEAVAAAAGEETEAESLVPEHDARVLPAPVMSVQATRFHAGGMALGVSALHAVVDGRAFVLFLDAWFSTCRGGSSSLAVAKSLPPPADYARDAIAHDELARDVLSKIAPDLPVLVSSKQVNAMTEGSSISQQHTRRQGRRQTFVLGADDIRRLKRRIDELALPSASAMATSKPVSTFVALSALAWTAFVKAKGLCAGEDTHLLFQVDVRARLNRPPGYFGNSVRGCIASADAGELLLLGGDDGLLRAARAIQAAVREVMAAAAPAAAGVRAWVEQVVRLPVARQVNVGGSPLFRLYQTSDFGLGEPDTVVPVYMPGSPEQKCSCAHSSGRRAYLGRPSHVLDGGR